MSESGPSRRFAARSDSSWNLRHSGLTSDVANSTLMGTGARAIDTAVVQTPYPPADLNVAAFNGAQRQVGQQRVRDI